MAKQGMKRPQISGAHPQNDAAPVPELQGKAKSGKEKAKPLVADEAGMTQKVWHEKPIPEVYRVLDTDLARDNLENDIPYADLQDL